MTPVHDYTPRDVRISDAEWRTMQREDREAASGRDYHPPIWGPMPGEHYKAMKRALRGYEAAQEVVMTYGGYVNGLLSYVAGLESMLLEHAPDAEAPAGMALQRMLLEHRGLLKGPGSERLARDAPRLGGASFAELAGSAESLVVAA